MRKSWFTRAIAALICALFMLAVTGCTQSAEQSGSQVDVTQAGSSSSADSITRPSSPVKPADGGKFKIAFIDQDAYYNETFRMLYYAVENLKTDGWISYDSLPYDPETDSDTVGLMNWLADNCESDCIEFDKSVNLYTDMADSLSEDGIRAALEEKIDEIDIILTLGTKPSTLVKSFGFEVPQLMYGVADPVGAGLVESTEKSGSKYLWAQVDSSAYSRQMQYYYDTFEFKNIGCVYGSVVAGMEQYRETAKANGFTITEYQIDRTAMDEDEYYKLLAETYKKMIEEDKVDAYILNTDVIPETSKAAELLQVFTDAGIPTFSQYGEGYVTDGAVLMMVNTNDAEGMGPFFSNIIGSVLNGADPGDLEQEYVSSPFLSINLDVADKIEYHPSFDMLIACENIVCSE